MGKRGADKIMRRKADMNVLAGAGRTETGELARKARKLFDVDVPPTELRDFFNTENLECISNPAKRKEVLKTIEKQGKGNLERGVQVILSQAYAL